MIIGRGLPLAKHSTVTFFVSLTVRGIIVNSVIFGGSKKAEKKSTRTKNGEIAYPPCTN